MTLLLQRMRQQQANNMFLHLAFSRTPITTVQDLGERLASLGRLEREMLTTQQSMNDYSEDLVAYAAAHHAGQIVVAPMKLDEETGTYYSDSMES